MRYVRYSDDPAERIPIDRCTASFIYGIRASGVPHQLHRVGFRWWWLRADQTEGYHGFNGGFNVMEDALIYALQRHLKVIQFKDQAEFGEWLGKGEKT